MIFECRLPDGQRVRVELPGTIRFSKPARSRTEAQAGIAWTVAQAVQPHLRQRLPEKRLERDAAGAISRVIEVPGASAAEQAIAVGKEVARRVMREAK